MKSRHASVLLLLLAALVFPGSARPPAAEKVDLDAVYRIKDEGLQRSTVMEIESYLTDVYGPRLTGSPNIKEAADWAQKRMKDWGLANVHLETWPFGRGWQNHRFVALATLPRAYPLIGYPKAWTPGTNGPVTGEAVIALIQNEQDFDVYRGKLRGKFVLRRRCATCRAVSSRRRAATPTPSSPTCEAAGVAAAAAATSRRPTPTFARKRTQFWIDEGVAAVLDFSRGDGGTVFVQAPPGVSREPNGAAQPAQVTLAVEHYGRSTGRSRRRLPVTLQMDIDNRFYDQDLNAFNILGELPGTDKADEVVMLGAHFDSWHAGTGATDNAAGSAVMMEAMRILKASGVTLRRTVRIGLWGGEEQGLLGSKEYVKAHFGDPATMQLKPEHARLAGLLQRRQRHRRDSRRLPAGQRGGRADL